MFVLIIFIIFFKVIKGVSMGVKYVLMIVSGLVILLYLIKMIFGWYFKYSLCSCCDMFDFIV